MIGMIGTIGVIGKDVLYTTHPQKRLYRRYRGLYRRYRSGLCMVVCTRAQNVFADRGDELKQALFDRRLWKELDLLQSVRQVTAKILKFAPNGHEPESEPFLSLVASQTPGPPSPRFNMDTDERKGNDPGSRRNAR
jgi:hypothetical protein